MLALIAKAEKNRQQSETRRDVEEKAEKEEKTRQGSALMDPIERQRSLLQKAEHSAAYDPSGYAPYHHTVSTRQRRMTTWRDGPPRAIHETEHPSENIKHGECCYPPCIVYDCSVKERPSENIMHGRMYCNDT